MSKDNVTVFGETTFRNNFRQFGIKTDDRRRHMYLIGKTGMGKSTVLENMIIDDIRAGHGVAVVDPHGDLAEKVIEYIPDERLEDVIYFNPADTHHPVAFNVVEEVDSEMRHLVASGLIGVFQKLWAESWGPRLEYILRNAILAILDHPGATLLSITRMLSDKEFRNDVIANIKDPVVLSFWTKEFAGYNDKFASEAVSPIQNKVGQFLSSSLIRNIVGQIKSTIDMRKIMDNKKILILNLSKGRIGEDNSTLLGAMIITKIQLAAMSRVDIPEKDRKDFYLYVDEFQNFTSDSFANILSEARKYRLNLVLAHQYIEQLTDTVRNAVFGNVGTLIIFRVGAADAEALAPELAPTFTAEDILNLPKYEIYLKLMIDGIASEPFSARGLYPKSESEKTGNLEEVVRLCREKYTMKKVDIEERIKNWHENISGPPVKGKKKANNPDIYKFEAKCNRCKKDTKTPFEPDGVRPVYCKDCLGELREEKQSGIEKRKEEKKEEIEMIDKNPALKKDRKPFKKVDLSPKTEVEVPEKNENIIAFKKPTKNHQKQELQTQNHQPKQHTVQKTEPAHQHIKKKTTQQKQVQTKPVVNNVAPERKTDETPSISLDELTNMRPVGFRGSKKREVKNVESRKKQIPTDNQIPKKENNNPNKKTTEPQEFELEEGSEVDFS